MRCGCELAILLLKTLIGANCQRHSFINFPDHSPVQIARAYFTSSTRNIFGGQMGLVINSIGSPVYGMVSQQSSLHA